MPELTSEYFESVGIIVRQPQAGFRYGGPSIALAEFCRARPGQRVAELGSGCGVVAMVIAARDHPDLVVAVEIQEPLHRIAVRNVEENGLGGIVSCIRDDYRRFAADHRRSFDIVLANPPFHAAGRGRISPNAQRALAHHELQGTIYDLVVAARTLLVPSGRLVLVFAEGRRQELLNAAALMGFGVRRMVRGFDQEGAGPSFIVEFERLPEAQVFC